jgi:hypothetical protein
MTVSRSKVDEDGRPAAVEVRRARRAPAAIGDGERQRES